MKERLIDISDFSVLIIEAMALLIILGASVGAFAGTLRALLSRNLPALRHFLWLRYARWLVAGLTFQLAADLIESSTATSWDAVGRLAAIAIIRTFLNYFLERDVEEVRRALEEQSHDAVKKKHSGVEEA